MPPDLEARLQALRDLIRAECTHYQLLGIPRNADRKSIKRAYYELAALVHPDRHGGRDLGAWKPLMEALFRHVTVAHDTLGDPEARRIYDLLLPPETHPPPPRVSTPPPSASPPRVSTPAPRVSTPAPRVPTPAPRMPTPAPRITTPVPVAAAHEAPSSERTASEIARRDALARRLLAGRTSMRRQDAPPPSVPRPEPEIPIVDVVPASDTLRAEAEALEFRGEFTKATKSWRRLSILDPSNPEVAARTARALLGSKDSSLHEAAELAKRALAAAPSDYKNHLLLAEIYLQAQLPSAARSVLEHALTLGNGLSELTTLLAKVDAVSKPARK
jgi:tetratricopeptide (TPR) repeat protein